MRTLYLHIGTPKTATTAIQQFCLENQNILNEAGYCYPDFLPEFPNIGKWRNAHFLVYDIIKAGDEDREITEKDHIIDISFEKIYAAFEQYDNIILSDESLWNFGKAQGCRIWQYIKEEVDKGIFSIKIIVYLRRQDEYIYSWWNQKIKEGVKNFTWDEMLDYKFIKVNYYDMLNTISRHIGKENIIVRPFDRSRFYGGAIHVDFLHRIGLELSDEYRSSSYIRNISLTKNNIEIKRILNSIPDLDSTTKTLYREMISKCSEENPESRHYNMFSKEELTDYMKAFEEDNRKIPKEYMDIDEDLFSTSYDTEEKWYPDNPYMYKDIILFMGNITSYLISENQKLKKELRQQREQLKHLKNNVYHPFKAISRKLQNK